MAKSRTPTATSNSLAATEARVILDSIRRLVRVLRISSRAAEKRVGLSGAQLFVLSKLSGRTPLSLNELADRTHTHQSSVSVVIQRLVDRGLVARIRSREDARRVELTLTPAAKTLLRKAPGAAQEHLVVAVESMPATRRRQLAQLLTDLVEVAGADRERPILFFEEEQAAPKRRSTAVRPAPPARKSKSKR